MARRLVKTVLKLTLAVMPLVAMTVLEPLSAGAAVVQPMMVCAYNGQVEVCGSPQYIEASIKVVNAQGQSETATNTIEYITSGGKTAILGCIAGVAALGLQTTISDGSTLIFDGALAKYSTSCVWGAVVSFLGWLT